MTYVSKHLQILVKISIFRLTKMRISVNIHIYMLAANFYRDLPMLAYYYYYNNLIFQVEGVFDSSSGDNLFENSFPTWWIVFSPLFVSDALNAYFCVIVFIRMYIDVSTIWAVH